MKRYQTILVAAALDERDETTLRYASRIARAAPSQSVYFVSVTPGELPPPTVARHLDLAAAEDGPSEDRMRATLEALPGLFPETTQVQTVHCQGSIVSELIGFAAKKSVDLLCLGRSPDREHDLLGDSAVKLLRKSPCSVFVVPSGATAQFRRILVPIDFSEHSLEALDVASDIAHTEPGAELTILHVFNVPTGYHKTGRTYEDFAASMRELAERQWSEVQGSVNFGGVPWSLRLELGEHVPPTVLRVADQMEAHLIVTGSHGRTRPSAVLLGHVADAVCSRSRRPLLVVKRKGEVVHFLRAMLELFDVG